MIHDAILEYLETELKRLLITEPTAALEAAIAAADPEGPVPTDPAIAGVVKLGPLQGDPDPDQARISVEIYENDPDEEIKGSGVSTTAGSWKDQVEEVECGGSITWRRRFTIKGRCLLETSREDLKATKKIASTVRSRIEKALLSLPFTLESDDEYVARGPFSQDLVGEQYQAGGPPDSYDYGIKVRFDVLTTTKVEV